MRFAAWVLEPLAAGRPGRYRRYDWAAGAFAEWCDLPVPDVLVVDGCGAAQRSTDRFAALRIWVEAPAPLRLERGIARDGEAREPASHACRGRNARNGVMFGRPGRLYEHRHHGLHHCLNVACESTGTA